MNMPNLLRYFPKEKYPKVLPNQKEALLLIEKNDGRVVLELPTGSGKTAVGYTFLKALVRSGVEGPLYYVVPTKTLVNQVKELHPEVTVVYGRNEYPCLYYKDEKVTAEESPCYMLDCPHRVDQETGETEVAGVKPCPYFADRYRAEESEIVACTTAFYALTQLFKGKEAKAKAVVFDEAHQIARVLRQCLSKEITDWHLAKVIELLKEIGAHKEARVLRKFRVAIMQLVRRRYRKGSQAPVIFEPEEVRELLGILEGVNSEDLLRRIKTLVKEKGIDPKERREVLKGAETLTRDLRSYVNSFQYALPDEERRRNALDYIYGHWKKEPKGNEKVKYRLFIKSYYVAPLVRLITPKLMLAYSATIGDADVFGFETGIKAPFFALSSDFPPENTGIFIPTDTPNLAMKARGKREPTQALRKIARACKSLARRNIRSLVVVVSETERQKFLWLCDDEGVKVISYGNGIPSREAARLFKEGEGDVLVGTSSNYAEGLDLPKEIAPVIFVLRPNYPRPDDPMTVFEERRFGGMRWALWNWRVAMGALQVRGRNVRSVKDLGITIFVSQQFRRFVPAILPKWLSPAYRGDLSFDECGNEAVKKLQ